MPRTAQLIGCLTQPVSTASDVPRADLAWGFEWRADLLGGDEPDSIRGLFDKPLIYTLRSRAEGGHGPNEPTERVRRIAGAVSNFEFIDLEAQRDLVPQVLEVVPVDRRIISWHGEAEERGVLERRFAKMRATPSRYYKMVCAAERPKDGVRVLSLLRSAGTDASRLIAFASGAAGAWSRVLAPWLGAPMVFAQAQPQEAASGQWSLAALAEDYGFPELGEVRELFGIVGRPVLHSLSPRLHNRMYRELGLENLYVPFDVRLFGDFWLDVVENGALAGLGFDLRGLSVTAPFKEIALAVSGAASPLTEKITAANTLVRRDSVWEAESTDPQGLVASFAARSLRVQGLAAAVVGAGGAGRAAAFALAALGATVTLVNRSEERGRRVAGELGIGFEPLSSFEPTGYQVLVNATPAGGSPGEPPFDVERLAPGAIFADLAYARTGGTELTRLAAARGLTVVSGREFLLHQAVSQFRLMTGRELDLSIGAETLGIEGAHE